MSRTIRSRPSACQLSEVSTESKFGAEDLRTNIMLILGHCASKLDCFDNFKVVILEVVLTVEYSGTERRTQTGVGS